MSVIYDKKKFTVKKQKKGYSSLTISNKKVTDIKEIQGLDELQDLSVLILDNNQISEIKGLDNLINLEILSLKNNVITEIKGIEKLTKLNSLNLSKNKIVEIKGLESLSFLKELLLWDNQITEIKGLQNLSNLKILGLFGNPVDVWVKAKLGPRKNIPQAAVAYCKKLLGVISYDSDEINQFLAKIWDEINVIIREKDYSSVMKKLQTVYNKVNVLDIEIFYKFFGTILLQNPDLFNFKFSQTYNYGITAFLTTYQCAKMEKFMLENYCLFENEQIITYFAGILSYKSTQIKGRIYISNLRIIVLGNILVEDHEELFWFFAPFWAITFELAEKISYRVQKRSIEKNRSSHEHPKFGLEFPIWNPKNIWSSEGSIGFTSNLTIQSKKKKFRIIIQPTEIIPDPKQQNHKTVKDIIPIIYKIILEKKEITI